jgi:hypothetical protein
VQSAVHAAEPRPLVLPNLLPITWRQRAADPVIPQRAKKKKSKREVGKHLRASGAWMLLGVGGSAVAVEALVAALALGRLILRRILTRRARLAQIQLFVIPVVGTSNVE